jgi:anti-anti-sigma regulatory factor
LTGRQQCSYEVAISERAVYVRPRGLATMNNCLSVRDFIEEMLRESHGFIVVDLATCTGMDSTFMGVLAGAAAFEKDDRQAGVAVVNAGERLVKLLESVGLTELILVDEVPFEAPGIEFLTLEDKPGEVERLKLVRSAHNDLIKVSEKNEKVFGALVRTLEAEMRERGMLDVE